MKFRPLLSLLFVLLITSLSNVSAGVTYIHTDALGSVTAESDESGNIIKRFHYEPYGKTLEGGQDDEPGYTGHVYDDKLGLNYMKARYYDPQVGRFYSDDPVGFIPGNSFSFNRYAYANNNPYKFVDPDGRFGVPGFFIGAGIEMGAQFATGSFDLSDILISGAVGAVTGGFGGKAAVFAINGTISAGKAVTQTSLVSGAASGAGSMGQDLANDQPVSTEKALVSTLGGTAGGYVAGKFSNSAASSLEKLSRMGGVNAHISNTTRSAYVGKAAEQTTSASGQFATIGANAIMAAGQKEFGGDSGDIGGSDDSDYEDKDD